MTDTTKHTDLAALIDMDGVLYDSMKYHTLAWRQMMEEAGIHCTRDEFYSYEGMTGAETIRMIMKREGMPEPTDDEIRRLYARKTEIFKQIGRKEPMPGASDVLKTLEQMGVKRVLVTGSGQGSLLDEIDRDYPGAFLPNMKVTARDVTHGKPDPEPYLRGLTKAGVDARHAFVIENAPLGVKAGKAAGCFTVAVTTGPIPVQEMIDAGADMVLPSMSDLALELPSIINKICSK